MASLDKLVARARTLPSKANAEVLVRYVYEESLEWELSTVSSRMDALMALGRTLGNRNWKDLTRDDVIKTIAEHRSQQGAHLRRSNQPGPPLGDSTRYQWTVHGRKFTRWVLDMEPDETPAAFKRLPFRKVDMMANRIRELALSPKEVRQLLAGARSTRDKAIIGVAVEGGFRASESAALRLDKMEARNHGWWLDIPSDEPLCKTGPRTVSVPVIAAKKLIDDWLQDHPRVHERGAPLFVSLSCRNHGARMTGAGIAAVIKRAAARANMRRIHSHMCRHTSVTLKIAKRMSPEAVRMIHGWSPRGNMMQNYTHALPHFQNLVLEAYGLPTDEPPLLDVLGSQPCLLCGTPMHVADATCSACSMPAGSAEARAMRQQESAVSFVAVELAAATGWVAPTRGNPIEQAIQHLRSLALAGGQPGEGDGFARWCLRQWGHRCP